MARSGRSDATGEDPELAGLADSRLFRWFRGYPPRRLSAAFVFANGFLTAAVLVAIAIVSRQPFVFPSIGPTAFMHFHTPLAPSASPRNTLLGTAVGILCGYASLWVTGLEHAPAAVLEDITLARGVAVALSLAATGGLMVLLEVVHPPAGATTLIVSLGLIGAPIDLCVVEAAVALMTLQTFAINRAFGIAYPIWSGKSETIPASPPA